MTEEARIKIIKAVDVRLSLCRHSSESSPAWTQGESGACLPQAGWEQAAEESRKGADGRLSGWRPTLVFSSLSFRRRPESSGFIIHSRVSGNDNLHAALQSRHLFNTPAMPLLDSGLRLPAAGRPE